MTTGFQPNAFQPDAFQVAGGNTGTTTYSITALPGSYSLTGSDVTISRNRALTASAGAYTITGSDVTLLRHRSITCLAGEYVITGSPVTITYSGAVTPTNDDEMGWWWEYQQTFKKKPDVKVVQAISEAAKEAVNAPEIVTEAARDDELEILAKDIAQEKLKADIAWNEFYAELLRQQISAAKTEAIRQEMLIAGIIAAEAEAIRQQELEDEQAILLMMFEL